MSTKKAVQRQSSELSKITSNLRYGGVDTHISEESQNSQEVDDLDHSMTGFIHNPNDSRVQIGTSTNMNQIFNTTGNSFAKIESRPTTAQYIQQQQQQQHNHQQHNQSGSFMSSQNGYFINSSQVHHPNDLKNVSFDMEQLPAQDQTFTEPDVLAENCRQAYKNVLSRRSMTPQQARTSEIFLQNKQRYSSYYKQKLAIYDPDGSRMALKKNRQDVSIMNVKTNNFQMENITENQPKFPIRKRLRRKNTEEKKDRDLDKIFLVEQLGKNKGKIFKERHVNEVAQKIKQTMNHRDNEIANHIISIVKDQGRICRECSNLGICSIDYVKQYPPYVQKYKGYIEDTVKGLTRKLKVRLIDSNVIRDVVSHEETKNINKDLKLYKHSFNYGRFTRERKLKSITTYVQQNEDSIWKALGGGKEGLEQYIACAGDDDVKAIFDLMKPKKNKRNAIKNPNSIKTASSLNNSFITQPKDDGRRNSYFKGIMEEQKKKTKVMDDTSEIIKQMRQNYQEKTSDTMSMRTSVYGP